jgi:rhodanese-related sulfurtransferase
MTELTVEQANDLAPLVTPTEAAHQVDAGAVLIDVRSAAGRAAAGTIPGAIVVAKDEVAQRLFLDSPDRIVEVQSLDTPVVVVCGSVLGSGPVAAQLLSNGFRSVVQVDGGFPAWQAVGLPIEPPVST